MKKNIILALLIVYSSSIFSQNKLEFIKLLEASMKIKTLYVDTINNDKMMESAIKGILESLDPHSVYIPKEEVKKMNEPLVGNFEGIGVQFQMLDDTLFVENTITDGPSERVGILPGDRIVAVNDSSIAGQKMTTTDIMKRLRGKKGTTVSVKVLRRGIPELIDFKITRDKIPLYSVDASYMATPTIGYIKLSKFSATSEKEFDAAFRKLQKQGLKDLILDLQSNGGGYLQTAIELADKFLGGKQLIVYTKGRNDKQTNYIASSRGEYRNGRLILLIDEYSASASEILSGAVQDWDRGIIVGRRSYGKGLVQQPINLSDGSIIRLTTSRYYTPSGRSIQRPYKDKSVSNYRHDVVERYNRGELMQEDSIHFPDSLRRQTLVLKRPVYGGGGIMPDIFVPLDTSYTSKYLTNIVAKGIVNSFASKFIEAHETELKKQYPSFEKFDAHFEVTDSILRQLVKTAENEKVEFDQEGFQRSKQFLAIQLKALFARRLWSINEFYQVYNTENEICKKAIEILSTPDMYENVLRKTEKQKNN
ncbi:MAG: S41 family peptidase [Prevotellaceae bacterium]|jgi:carboxyl-terminal processing protease|nr:S41 family peptidase [Prevotellaceae bacterium]